MRHYQMWASWQAVQQYWKITSRVAKKDQLLDGDPDFYEEFLEADKEQQNLLGPDEI